MKISKQHLKDIVQEELIGEAQWGGFTGGAAPLDEPTPEHADPIPKEQLKRLWDIMFSDMGMSPEEILQTPEFKEAGIEDPSQLELDEGRLVGRGVAKDIANTMNSLAKTLTNFDPKSLEGRGGRFDAASEDLRAAWIALQSSFDQVFGDSLENTTAPASTPLEEACGGVVAMTDEPMPMPGPPPEGGGVMEPAFDDHEGRMAKSQLSKLVKDSNDLVAMLGDKDQLPSWVQAKVTKAADYLGAVKQYLEYERLGASPMHEGKLARGRLMKLAGIKIL